MADVSFGALLNDTFSEYSKDFMKYFQNLLVIYVIPATILAFLFNLGYGMLQIGNYFTGSTIQNYGQIPNIGILVLIGFIYFVYLILSVILGSLFSSALFRIKKLKDNNRNIDTKTVFRDAKKYILPNIGLGIIQFLIFVGIFILCAIPVGVVYLGTMSKIMTGIAGIVMIIALIIIWTSIVIKWSFSSVALLYDEKKVVESLKASKKIVKGNWWNVFGKVLLIGLIVGGIAGALTLPLMLVTFILSLIPIVGNAIQSGISAAISAAIAPLGMIFLTRLYLGMKENK